MSNLNKLYKAFKVILLMIGLFLLIMLIINFTNAFVDLNGGSDDPKFEAVDCVLHDERCR